MPECTCCCRSVAGCSSSEGEEVLRVGILDSGRRRRRLRPTPRNFPLSNHVVSKRMVKQQMQWSEAGAHHLPQVRTKVLNNELRETFTCWYPGMRTDQEANPAKKAA
jgi:hypothetical protein